MDVVVDDRTFVVGLSEAFRQRMKAYEVATLLPLAETACRALHLSPAMVPIEGYYSESDELEKLFRLVRAMQQAEIRQVSPGPSADAVHRLREVFTSPAMGRVEKNDRVLPRTNSPLGEALRIVANWSVSALSRQAQRLVRDDDAGLVAVAAATGDPIALCVARESVALSADVELAEVESPGFIWAVSGSVAKVAGRFVSALAETTGIVLPEPEATSSHLYGQAARDAELEGRCILIGEQSASPYPYYHWYVEGQAGESTVKDFWSSAVWTTAHIRNIPVHRRPAMGAQLGPPETGNRSTPGGGMQVQGPLTGDREHEGRRWLARLLRRSE